MHPTKRKRADKATIPLFAEKPSHPPAPLICSPAAARSAGQGRPLGRRLGTLPLRGASTVAGWTSVWRMVFLVAAFLFLALSPQPVHAQETAHIAPATRMDSVDPLSEFVAEAARRFDIPAPWIHAVMQVESGNNANAISPKGALGLMQLMPATYQAMRIRYGLGADPLQPHDNIIAGTAYLREMLDCFGTAGFLAAYNAGPERYDAHLANGEPLPTETLFYVARITPMLGGEQPGSTAMAPPLEDWMHAPLFAGHFPGSMTAETLQSGRASAAPSPSSLVALVPQPGDMFAPHFAAASP